MGKPKGKSSNQSHFKPKTDQMNPPQKIISSVETLPNWKQQILNFKGIIINRKGGEVIREVGAISPTGDPNPRNRDSRKEPPKAKHPEEEETGTSPKSTRTEGPGT